MRIERLVLALSILATGGIGSAAYAIDPLDAISVCSRINKKDARLECYDQVAADAAAGRLQSNAAPASSQGWAAPPVGGAQATPAPRPQANTPSSSFGAAQLPRSAAPTSSDPDSLRAEVASSTDNGLGLWRIRLADGAIWQMTESDSMFRPPAPREVVTIRKAALGSFLMDVGSQGSVRVRRVR